MNPVSEDMCKYNYFFNGSKLILAPCEYAYTCEPLRPRTSRSNYNVFSSILMWCLQCTQSLSHFPEVTIKTILKTDICNRNGLKTCESLI